MRTLRLALLGALLLIGTAGADPAMHGDAMHTIVMPEGLMWGPAPPGLPPGSKVALLAGDPGSEGPYTLRALLPRGYKVPPHWHYTTEHLTVISGSLRAGMGEMIEMGKGTVMGAGAFAVMPAKMNHWVVAETDTVLQVHGQGPFLITYVNPADDPRMMK